MKSIAGESSRHPVAIRRASLLDPFPDKPNVAYDQDMVDVQK